MRLFFLDICKYWYLPKNTNGIRVFYNSNSILTSRSIGFYQFEYEKLYNQYCETITCVDCFSPDLFTNKLSLCFYGIYKRNDCVIWMNRFMRMSIFTKPLLSENCHKYVKYQSLFKWICLLNKSINVSTCSFSVRC